MTKVEKKNNSPSFNEAKQNFPPDGGGDGFVLVTRKNPATYSGRNTFKPFKTSFSAIIHCILCVIIEVSKCYDLKLTKYTKCQSSKNMEVTMIR